MHTTTVSTELHHVEKKAWHEPQMTQLEIKETKTLQWTTSTEDGTFQGFFGGAS